MLFYFLQYKLHATKILDLRQLKIKFILILVFVDTGSRAAADGFLDQIMQSTIRYYNLCFFTFFIESEYFTIYFLTGAATYTLILINWTLILLPSNAKLSMSG